MTRPRVNFANTDAAFCEKVTRIATAQGWRGEHLESQVGHSFAFEHPDHRRVAGDIFKQQHAALADACKRILPFIYQHL
ncbi:MAG: hypothetical protein HY302_09265 [Opitutae bacterium]|nr:hypothetical protein [Opitutae bacterium]